MEEVTWLDVVQDFLANAFNEGLIHESEMDDLMEYAQDEYENCYEDDSTYLN